MSTVVQLPTVTLEVTEPTGTTFLSYGVIPLIAKTNVANIHVLVLGLRETAPQEGFPFPTVPFKAAGCTQALLHEIPAHFDFVYCQHHWTCRWVSRGHPSMTSVTIAFNNEKEFHSVAETMANLNSFDIGNPNTGVMAVTHIATVLEDALCEKQTGNEHVL
ncbi:hypothetical protein L226DRAFT_567210 [Lentinus tigrinus ALCF2SS1-7]|uniref:uncharacterized protein n=1 Tax=Lentinus tigrinus ALCF2SS1-7 TaxID=1328758 RepID=UPI001165FFCA|nr:hypothetical protein L226DRAFT_567210 [Lentinus tigrinus ALCF2SS1-7]